MRLWRRSATDIDNASRVAPIAFRKPSAARSPPTLRILSLNTGSYSTQWPSPSTIGWSIFERTCSGVMWALMIFSGNCVSTPSIVRATHALRHKRSALSIAPGARPPVICAGSIPPRLLIGGRACRPAARSAGHTPGDGVAQQRGERVGFPRASKRERCRVRRVGGPGRADGGVVAMAESKVGHAAAADLTCIAEHAGPAVGLQGGVRSVKGADGG